MNAIRTLRRPSARTAAALLGVLLLLGLGAGGLLNLLRGPTWSADTAVLVRTWTIDSLLLNGDAEPVTSQDQADAAVVAVSQEVLTRARDRLGDGRSVTDLGEDVTALPDATSHFVTITATAGDEALAARTSQAVAEAFAAVTRERLSQAAAGLTSTEAGRANPEVVLRSQVLTWTLQPVEIYRTSPPEQLTPNLRTPVALGVVGLAVGGLALLALFLAQPNVGSARDAQRACALPAVDFGPDDGVATARLVAQLRTVHPKGTLMVCPVDAASEKAGLELVEWIRGREPEGAFLVSLLPEPTGAVLGAKPRRTEASALVLVVPRGTRRSELADAVALLTPWRAVDAVIVVP